MVKKFSYLIAAALLVAWAFDFLFWQKIPGISYALYVALCLGIGFFLTWKEDLRPANRSLWILLPVILFGILTFIRRETFTLALDYLLTISLMALLAMTFLGGRWMQYSASDYFVGMGKLVSSTLVRPIIVYYNKNKLQEESEPQNQPIDWRRGVPILRGLLLTLPILVIFSALLAAADPIFSQRLESLVAVFRIEKLPEYLFRAIYISIFAYFLAGIYLHTLTASYDQNLIGLDKPWLQRFLGFTEASIILFSIDLLFIVFVTIQFRYFFGGQENISIEGFTYAEYARRGFGELLAVAFFSLLILLGLSTITKRETVQKRRNFSILAIVQVALLAIILVSAFQRLLLYEQAYGFTRLRTYTHVFMIWLGVLLGVLVIIEMRSKLRYFALSVLVVILGFGLTLNFLNVDAFIVRQNVARALAGVELDIEYLMTLSNDSIPTVVQLFEDPSLPTEIRDDLGSVLDCRATLLTDNQDLPWQSLHFSDMRASNLLANMGEVLRAYPVRMNEQGHWFVEFDGQQVTCIAPH